MRQLRGLVMATTAALAVGWFGGRVWSEDPPKDPGADEAAKWEKLGAPGAEHARLKQFVGTWDVKGTGGPGEMKGTATMTLLFGGRYLAQEFKGDVGGKAFEGRGLLAYDNGAKRWSSSWIDNYSSCIAIGDGEEKEKGKSWEFKSKFAGPDGPVELRDVWKVVSDKEYTIESYMTGAGDEPVMTLRFTKK